ncbi:MAG: DEAD/DEAH box helicase [Candidatus Aenigmatarchaeota archaeon]
MSFELLSKKLQDIIKQKGFLEPTLAQKLAVPELLGSSNVLVIAPTGFGKTEAVMLPVFDKIASADAKPISALYLTPTRSLNRDMLDRLYWWADKLDLEIGVRHGDTPVSERTAQREMPPNILITTPESLGSIIVGKKIREHLRNVRCVVIDEVHELVDSKRGIQLSLVLERLDALVGKPVQRIALSATVGDPDVVAAFVGKAVKIIRADAEKKYEINVQLPIPNKLDKKIAEELFVGEDTTARIHRILETIKQHKSVIVFTNTRQTAEVLSSRFKNLDKDLKQAVHHGSLAKEVRIESEKLFKTQQLKALVATSSLELGIDIGSIDFIIQYLSPRQVAPLIQRIGRSGHAVGGVSKGIVLTGGEDVFESSVIAKEALARNLEGVKVHDLAADVLVHQIVGAALENKTSASGMYKMFKNAYPYRNLKEKDFLKLVRFMGQLYLLWLEPVYDAKEKIIDYVVGRTKRGWEYYYENLSTIPDVRRKRIISVVEGEPVGFLDESFLAEHGQSGNTFICDGRAWKIVDVDEKKVLVEPIDDVESAIPSWEGELIPVPFRIAQDVAEVREFISDNIKSKDLTDKLMEKYPIDQETSEMMINIMKKHAKKHIIPTKNKLLLESYKDFVILHSSFGTLINDTISRYVASELTLQTGASVNIKVDPYRIMFRTIFKPEKIAEILCNSNKVEETLRINLERSSLFKWRFIHVARRFGILSRRVNYEQINLGKIIQQYESSPAYEETLREIMLEKMDLENASKILEKIRKGDIKIVIAKGLSYLGELGLSEKFGEVIKPKLPESEIFSAFRRRLMHTRVRLVCTNCGDYTIPREVKNVTEKESCPKCRSSLIALCSIYKREPLKVLKKYKEKAELSREEKKELAELKRAASLMITYGKRYAMTYAGKGIGPDTAARILARLPKDEEQLIKYIYEAEKLWLKNKKYWS